MIYDMEGGSQVKEQLMSDPYYFGSLTKGFSEALVSGRFCDVKIICEDSNLWAHRMVLSSVSPFLRNLLMEMERRGDDVITIFLPKIKGYHMKLVLDYIYSGTMYLCGAHIQYVIQVMEVLNLKCGVSVNKMVQSTEADHNWIEVEHSTLRIKSKFVTNKTEPKEGLYRKRKSNKNDLESSSLGQKKSKYETRGTEAKGSVDVEEKELVKTLKETQQNKKHFDNDQSEDYDKSEQNIVDVEDVRDDDFEKEDFDNFEGPESTYRESSGEEEPVMVELDEDFAVDSLSTSQAQENEGRKHKCALCGRTFRFYDNLRIHLTGHLGVKVTLSRCQSCKRNFRNQTELELHRKAHDYARYLGKYRRAHTSASSDLKIITTTGSTDKKLIRKYTKRRHGMLLTKKVADDDTTVDSQPDAVNHSGNEMEDKSKNVKVNGDGPTSGNQFTCTICDKSFMVKSMYLRHMKHRHDQNQSQDKTVSTPNSTRSHKRPSISDLPKTSTSSRTDLASPVATHLKQDNPYSRQYSTPSRKRDTSESDQSPLPSLKSSALKRKRGDPIVEKGNGSANGNSLQCQDCDKVFVAKTILERHQYTAKHGVYGTNSSDSGPGSPSVQHVTERRVDCHLCGQIFLRVKDLVKHREKVCTAWLNPGK